MEDNNTCILSKVYLRDYVYQSRSLFDDTRVAPECFTILNIIRILNEPI